MPYRLALSQYQHTDRLETSGPQGQWRQPEEKLCATADKRNSFLMRALNVQEIVPYQNLNL